MQTSSDEIAAGDRLFARPWAFVMSVPSLELLPPAGCAEIAFAGRSNVGKSSLLNALVRRRELARTSNTPGRTQQLNYFAAPGVSLFLVDMPGYGFAKAPKKSVEAWTALVNDYLKGRRTLTRVFLLIDSRHGIKPVDAGVMQMLDQAAISYQIVLTKSDKVSTSALHHMIATTEQTLQRHPAAYPEVIATSAEKGAGLEELRAAIAANVKSVASPPA